MELLDRLKTAPYGAFAIDLEQNIIFWNPRAERILGFEPRQVLGRKCYEVLQGLALEGAIPFCTRDCPAIAAARAGHIPAATQARMQCASGERKQVTVIPLIAHDDQDRTVLVHMFHETPAQGPCPSQGEALPVTPREHEVLGLLARGMRPTDIAASLSISVHTVRKHISNAGENLHSHGAMSAVLAAQRQHLI
jgi:DNA-binding CsgD family transcriptional regulator